MKAPAPIPKNIRLIDREEFLAAVEPRGHMLLRARLESPDTHLLVIYADPAERYAVVGEIGPGAGNADLREAARNAPPGLALHYVVPCAHCPPYVLPKGLSQTPLPRSLCPLAPPPAGFGAEEAGAPAENPATVEDDGAPAAKAPAKPAPAASAASPVRPPRPSAPVLSLPGAPKAAAEPVAPAPPEPVPAGGAGSLAALFSRSLQDIEKSLAERESELHRRDAAIREREQALMKDRRLLEEEIGRINAGLESREMELLQRENDFRARTEGLVRALRELDELRRKIESLST